MNDTLEKLYKVVLDRKANPQEGSYTCYLFDKGLDKILKKVGEECSETIIAAKNGVESDTVLMDQQDRLPLARSRKQQFLGIMERKRLQC